MATIFYYAHIDSIWFRISIGLWDCVKVNYKRMMSRPGSSIRQTRQPPRAADF